MAAERDPRPDDRGAREAMPLTERAADAVEQVVIAGDLSKLTPEQRVTYYHQVCQSTGLNPLTRPFDYIVLNGKLTLYARRDAADQLRKRHAISIQITSRDQIGDTRKGSSVVLEEAKLGSDAFVENAVDLGLGGISSGGHGPRC